MKTISVARAYFLPVWGLDGAGDGGRSWPSKSMCAKALLSTLVFGVEAADRSGMEEEEPDSDIGLNKGDENGGLSRAIKLKACISLLLQASL